MGRRGVKIITVFLLNSTHKGFPLSSTLLPTAIVVGVPVEWESVARNMVESGHAVRREWYQVHAVDYLERGHAHLGMGGKLGSYLKTRVCDELLRPSL